MQTEVTFCLPVFNAAKNINHCIDGVLAQAMPNSEILLIDNASTDGTFEIATQRLGHLPNVRLVRNETNLGRIQNWNRGIELARGRYLRYAMANDIWLAGSSALLHRELARHPKAAFIACRYETVSAVPKEIPHVPAEAKVELRPSCTAIERFSFQGNDTSGLNAVLFRVDAIRRKQLSFRTDIPYFSDFCFVAELAGTEDVLYADFVGYYFDDSVAGRFTFSALKAETYYREARETALVIGHRLQACGLPRTQGFEFIFRQYIRQHGYDLPDVGYRFTFQLFAGAGAFKHKALRYKAARDLRNAAVRFRMWAGTIKRRINPFAR